jgi:poly(glycerol-phosphate) alpha-glucosyltransferase
MKVVALTNFLSDRGGGIPPAMIPLYETLAIRGVEVVLAATDHPSRATTVHVAPFVSLGPKSFGFSTDLLNLLDRENPDIVHLHGLWTYGSIAAQVWSHRTGKPVVVSPHGMLDPWALRHRRLKKALAGAAFEWRNLRNASRLHALNDGEVKALEACGLAGWIVKIPNGVALGETGGADRRQRSSTRTLLYLGRLHPKKGLAETLVAWSLARNSLGGGGDPWRLVIAGWDDGGHQQELRGIVETRGLQDCVEFRGPVFGSDKDALYREADAFILASHSEGLPMTVLEAWSHAKPVFMTDECNLPEGFANGAAFRVETDPADIARALKDVLADETRLIAAGQAGRALVERSFNWPSIADQWLAVYAALVDARSNAATLLPREPASGSNVEAADAVRRTSGPSAQIVMRDRLH